jgi:hypothetical protein
MHNNKQNPSSSSDVQPDLVPPPGVAETAEERVVRQARIAAEGVTPAILSAIIGSNMVGSPGRSGT